MTSRDVNNNLRHIHSRILMRITFGLVTLALATLIVSCSGNDIHTIEASGTIEGTEINVGAEAAGRVREVRVDEGSRVSTGDTLLVIDDTEYRMQLAQATANQQAFESQYRLILEGSRKEDLTQAEANFKSAESDFQRMKELLATHTVTQKQYDDTYARYVSAQQTYEKLMHGARAEEITGARVKRDQAAAQADLLRKKLRDCSILAPSGGVITLKGIEPGELVGVGSRVLRISILDTVKLTIYVKEADLGRVMLGQSAGITIDTYGSQRTFPGTISYISPVAEFTPKNVQTKEERTKLVYAVRIRIPNPDGALKPGMPADARVNVDGK